MLKRIIDVKYVQTDKYYLSLVNFLSQWSLPNEMKYCLLPMLAS